MVLGGVVVVRWHIFGPGAFLDCSVFFRGRGSGCSRQAHSIFDKKTFVTIYLNMGVQLGDFIAYSNFLGAVGPWWFFLGGGSVCLYMFGEISRCVDFCRFMHVFFGGVGGSRCKILVYAIIIRE